MTFKEKLEKFKSEQVGFRVSSEEIANELAKVFTKEHMEVRTRETSVNLMKRAWEYAKENSFVIYNYHVCEHKLSFGSTFLSGSYFELLDVTLEELKAYNS